MKIISKKLGLNVFKKKQNKKTHNKKTKKRSLDKWRESMNYSYFDKT